MVQYGSTPDPLRAGSKSTYLAGILGGREGEYYTPHTKCACPINGCRGRVPAMGCLDIECLVVTAVALASQMEILVGANRADETPSSEQPSLHLQRSPDDTKHFKGAVMVGSKSTLRATACGERQKEARPNASSSPGDRNITPCALPSASCEFPRQTAPGSKLP